MSAETMLDRLDRYYREQGISPIGFKCPSFEKCSSVCATGQMATAEAPYVGPEYEEGRLPRLLFVSSDTCDAWYKDHPELVTLERIRQLTLSKGLDNRPPNTHWYKTFDLARFLMSPFAENRLGRTLGLNDVVGFFAHTRSVRCKDGSIGTREGSNLMAINCSRFLKGEVEIMQPDIIVTQGARARNALAGAFPVIRHDAMPGNPRHRAFYEIIQITDSHAAIKIVAWHPCAHWKGDDKKKFVDWAVKCVQEFIPAS